MSLVVKAINFLMRLLIALVIIAISLKGMQDQNEQVKIIFKNISKVEGLIKLYLGKDFLNYIYHYIPMIYVGMNCCFLTAALISVFGIGGHMLFVNIGMIIEIVFVNNIFLDQSSKCYLLFSVYLGIYGIFTTYADETENRTKK